MLGAIRRTARLPLRLARSALLTRVPARRDRRRDLEGRRRPADRFAGVADFVGAQGFAVRLGRASAGRRTAADGGAAIDQRGFVARRLRLGDRLRDRRHIMAVDRADDVPAVGAKPRRRVVREPAQHGAVDGDAVVVVQRNQLVELPGTGQGTGLVADAFHQAAVTKEHIAVVIDDAVARPVELVAQQLLGQRHAHRIGDALAERPGGGLHAGRETHLGMPRCLAVQLAETPELVDRQVVAAQMQQRVDEHRRVAIGQHETIAVRPVRMGRVVAQVLSPQGHGHLGHAHGRAGVTGVGLLHRVHGERTQGVGAFVALTVVGADHAVVGGGAHRFSPRFTTRRARAGAVPSSAR